MKSRTSFFNPTALRKDITRFAPVWAIYLIGGLLIGLTTLSASDYARHTSAQTLASTIGALTVVNLVYAIINAELLFGDLFNNRLCNALHALPLRRESWFTTHTVAGLLFSFVPNLILSICFLPLMRGLWYVSFIWLLGVTLTYVFFFGLSIFSAMCTGNRFAMVAVYTIINFASMIAYWFVCTFYAPLLYGLHIRDKSFALLCPSVWAADLELVKFHYTAACVEENGLIAYVQNVAHFDGLTPNWWYLAVIAVLGIALLGAAVLLYRRRKLESAGDFVAFSWLKPIFSVVFTLSMGALFEMFGDLFIGTDYVFLAVGIVVGYFVSQMLLQRTVRVFRKKAFAACAAIGVAFVLSIGLTAVDPFGITRWTPKPEKVESIILSKSYYYEPDQTRHAQTITNREMIADLVQIHEYILENDDRNDRYDYQAIHLTYKMSDGRQIERRYRFAPDNNTAKKLERFFSAPEFVLGYDDWNDYLNNIGYIELDNYSGFFHELTNAESVELMKSIKADCEAGNFPADAYKEYVWVTIFDDKGNYIDSFDVSIAAGNACDWLAQNVPELFE